VNRSGGGVVVDDIDMVWLMLVDVMLMFILAGLEVECIVKFDFVVVVEVPEYAVYAADALLMDDAMLAGMLLIAPPAIVPPSVAPPAAAVADDDGAMEEIPAAPQSVLAKVRAAGTALAFVKANFWWTYQFDLLENTLA
jgi:hypothetical protein